MPRLVHKLPAYRCHKKSGGKPAKLVVEGQPIAGTLVPYAKAGSVVTIDCDA